MESEQPASNLKNSFLGKLNLVIFSLLMGCQVPAGDANSMGAADEVFDTDSPDDKIGNLNQQCNCRCQANLACICRRLTPPKISQVCIPKFGARRNLRDNDQNGTCGLSDRVVTVPGETIDELDFAITEAMDPTHALIGIANRPNPPTDAQGRFVFNVQWSMIYIIRFLRELRTWIGELSRNPRVAQGTIIAMIQQVQKVDQYVGWYLGVIATPNIDIDDILEFREALDPLEEALTRALG